MQTTLNNLAAQLCVLPSRALVDEKLEVVQKNLLPGQDVTLHSLMRSDDCDLWQAYGHYVSDNEGAVKAAEHVSVGGSYLGTEPMGLICSMKPVPGGRTELRLRKKDVSTPMVAEISVFSGHFCQGFGETKALGCAVAERWYTAPGVRRVEVTEGGVRGTLFLPPGPGPFPGILDLWEAGGGLVEFRSALLASHGYAALALEYITRKTLSDPSQVVKTRTLRDSSVSACGPRCPRNQNVHRQVMTPITCGWRKGVILVEDEASSIVRYSDWLKCGSERKWYHSLVHDCHPLNECGTEDCLNKNKFILSTDLVSF